MTLGTLSSTLLARFDGPFVPKLVSVLREGFGSFFVDYYLRLKQAEIDRFELEVSDWEQREYFSLF